MRQEKLIKKYDKHVTMYERNRDHPVLATWRNKLIRNAFGKVLEVGIGVGSNFPYYNKEKVTEVIGIDFSGEMLKSAKISANQHRIHANFIQQDIDKLDLQSDSVETIVSTLTVCSYPNPIETLNRFNDWCQKDGQILLMEHGLSYNLMLRLTQKIIDPLYIKISGCHCNRNMLDILQASKLQVVHVERYWAGIMQLIWAKPTK